MAELISKTPSEAFFVGITNINAFFAGPVLRSRWATGSMKGVMSFMVVFWVFNGVFVVGVSGLAFASSRFGVGTGVELVSLTEVIVLLVWAAGLSLAVLFSAFVLDLIIKFVLTGGSR